MDSLELTKKFVNESKDLFRKMAMLVSHDPISGRKAIYPLFKSDERLWILVTPLNASAFKDAYLAQDSYSSEQSVISITKNPMPQDEGEMAIAQKLQGKRLNGVVEIYDVFDMNTGQKAIRTHYFNGGCLEGRSLSLPEKMVVAEALVEGLESLHEAGILHRDIKPANVLLETQNGLVKSAALNDFGEGTLLEKPRSIHNIEHFYSSPLANQAMEDHKVALQNWYDSEDEAKEFDHLELEPTAEYLRRKGKVDEEVKPLVEELRKITNSVNYDRWQLGLTLWCLFNDKREKDFAWHGAVPLNQYGKIAKLKREFVDHLKVQNLPDLYKELIAKLLTSGLQYNK